MLDVVRVLMICSTCGDVSLETEMFDVIMRDGRYVVASFSECRCGYLMTTRTGPVITGEVGLAFSDEQLQGRIEFLD